MIDLVSTLITEMFSSVISLFTYLAIGYGLYCMADSTGFKNPWMSWIPFTQDYTLGAVADEYCKRNEGRTTTYRKKLLGLLIALSVVTIIVLVIVVVFIVMLMVSGVLSETYTTDAIMNGLPEESELIEDLSAYLGLGVILLLVALALAVIGIVYTVFRYIALHKIYKLFSPDSANLYLVLSIFIPLATPILFFVLAKKTPVFTDRDAFFGTETDAWDWNT